MARCGVSADAGPAPLVGDPLQQAAVSLAMLDPGFFRLRDPVHWLTLVADTAAVLQMLV